MAHGDARGVSEEETSEWSGWPVLFTLPRNMVYPALLQLMRTPGTLCAGRWVALEAGLDATK